MTKTKKILHSGIKHVPSTKRTRFLTEFLGWYGAVAVLSAYSLSTFGALDIHSNFYLILNFTGAIGILAVATAKHVRQSMLVNAFWAAMAGLALIRIVLQV